VHAELLRIVSTAHDASFYDLDLHPKNILVQRRTDGLPGVVLFDFNKIPFHEWPPNVVVRHLVALGYIKPESRDLRHLCAIRKVLRLSPEAAFDSACRRVGGIRVMTAGFRIFHAAADDVVDADAQIVP
jgi:hypothetical protein